MGHFLKQFTLSKQDCLRWARNSWRVILALFQHNLSLRSQNTIKRRTLSSVIHTKNEECFFETSIKGKTCSVWSKSENLPFLLHTKRSQSAIHQSDFHELKKWQLANVQASSWTDPRGKSLNFLTLQTRKKAEKKTQQKVSSVFKGKREEKEKGTSWMVMFYNRTICSP